MFRDYKSGGDNLESTGVSGTRLIALIILITVESLKLFQEQTAQLMSAAHINDHIISEVEEQKPRSNLLYSHSCRPVRLN